MTDKLCPRCAEIAVRILNELEAHPKYTFEDDDGTKYGYYALGLSNGAEAIRAHSAERTEPDGWVSVPRDITEKMIEAWTRAATFEEGYKAMLAAAPTNTDAGNGGQRESSSASQEAPADVRCQSSVPDVRNLSADHPELTCERCGGPNITWFAPSPLWSKYAGEHSILCPICFTRMAENDGLKLTAWRVAPEEHGEPAPSVPSEMPEKPTSYFKDSTGFQYFVHPAERIVTKKDYDKLRTYAESQQREIEQLRNVINGFAERGLDSSSVCREKLKAAEAELLVRTENYEYQRQRAEHLASALAAMKATAPPPTDEPC